MVLARRWPHVTRDQGAARALPRPLVGGGLFLLVLRRPADDRRHAPPGPDARQLARPEDRAGGHPTGRRVPRPGLRPLFYLPVLLRPRRPGDSLLVGHA